jgi:hypothetical protein
MPNIELFEVNGNYLPELTKEQIVSGVNYIKSHVLDGGIDALDVLICSKKIQEYGKQLEEQMRPLAEEKTRLQKGEVYSRFSADVTEKIIGSKTDYTSCGDPEWDSLQQTLMDLKDAIRNREAFLSGIKEPTTIVTKDGEVVTINPPIKSGRLGLALTLK